jgi:MoxR-like ATPase
MDFKNFIDECSKTIVGNQKNIKLSISAIISEGSILIEDYPGTGKTTFAFPLFTFPFIYI